MSAQESVDVLRESIEIHNDPETREQHLEDYSEALVVHGADADGYEELVAFYETVWETIPDTTVTIDRAIAEGDEVAV